MERKSRNQILKEVKERISTGNYNEIHKLRSINSTCKVVILGNRKLKDKEIYEYYEKILELQEDEEHELDALGCLVDNISFNQMNDSEQQRYILDLSKLYLALKSEIE